MPNILIAGELHPAGIDFLKKRSNYTFDYIKEVSDENFLPYLVGGILWGMPVALLVYFLSKPIIITYQKRKKKSQNK